MKLKELKDKPLAELEKMLREQREHLRATRFAIAASQESNVRKVRNARKTIARILTLLKKETSK
ncbi:MAG: 50S ribosomal protein L29 [Patescibacteria group bacterium]|jgi:ribosomal protein L29